jgi:hypothetical protein
MADDNGISNGLKISPAVAMTMAAFCAIAFYNIIELGFIIAFTFRKRKGLYFWSFVVATFGILPYTLGFAFKFFDVISQSYISVTMIVIGWYCMVTGQSFVLYSRLHLVVRDSRILHGVLAMIITNAIICHLPVTVLVYGANSNNPAAFMFPYSVYEKIQVTIFFIQESIISGLYVFSIFAMLKPSGSVKGPPLRKAMRHLMYINIAIVIMDLTILGTEYAGHYEIQTLYKGALYSVKLKLEFRILNELIDLSHTKNPCDWYGTSTSHRRSTWGDYDQSGGCFDRSARANSDGTSIPYGVDVEAVLGPKEGTGFLDILKETKLVVEGNGQDAIQTKINDTPDCPEAQLSDLRGGESRSRFASITEKDFITYAC